jgi:threonine dehydrogenase-like Zn-dependent dehydrogenase
MKKLILQGPGRLEWVDHPEPVSTPGEALVRVLRCGVCGTDFHAIAGRQPLFTYPRCLGHELCVQIIEAEDPGLHPGDLCAVEPYLFCGTCAACLSGKTNCCSNLRVMGVHVDGGLAPIITVPIDKLHPAANLTPDLVALVEPLVIGAHGVERAAPRPGEPVLVVGLGPIGIAAALFARRAGANVLCADIQPDRVAFAERLSLGYCIQSTSSVQDDLMKHFGQLPALIIDATGNPGSMHSTFELAEHGGRIVFLGLFQGNVMFSDPDFHRRELTLLASRAGLPSTFDNVIRLLQSGEIDPMPLITHRFPFNTAAELLPTIHREPGLTKALIDFS